MASSDLFLFVSHVAENRNAAMEIVGELERRGTRCWIAPRDVRPGEAFDNEIADAIEASRAMLLIFSDLCNDSEYIRREVTVAGESHKTVIPFRIEDVQPRRGLRVRLSDLHWIDGFTSRERAIDEVIKKFVPSTNEPVAPPLNDGGQQNTPKVQTEPKAADTIGQSPPIMPVTSDEQLSNQVVPKPVETVAREPQIETVTAEITNKKQTTTQTAVDPVFSKNIGRDGEAVGGPTMGFVDAIKSGFSHYVTFAGRAPRSKFWFWTLFVVIVSIVTSVIDAILGTLGIVGLVVSLALLLPGISVAIRRLHDLDRTGWWMLIALTGIGMILLIVWDCMKGTTGSNRFGADPLAA